MPSARVTLQKVLQPFRRATSGVLLACLLGVNGCLGVDTITSDAGRFPELMLRTNAVIVTADRPSSRSVRFDVERFNYRGPITMSADSVPPGVTVTFTPAVIEADLWFTIMVIKVADNAEQKESRVLVRAKATGVPTKTAAIELVTN